MKTRERPIFDLFTGFLEDADEAGRNFVAQTVPKATLEKQKSDFAKFVTFLETKSVRPETLKELDGKTMNALVMTFIMELKPKQGEYFEPRTYTGIIYSLEHKLKEMELSDWDIRSSPSYAGARDVLKAKMAMAKGAGKGNRPNRAQPLSRDEENKMWEKGALGTSDPDTLLRTLWWGLTTGFGLRGQDEHRQLLWEDVTLKTDSEKREFIEYSERTTKTRKGGCTGRA